MKKTLVALAVSSVAVSSMSAFAADEATKFDTYGNIQLVYADSDDDGSQIADNGSTFGFQGSTAISQDLTGFFKYELEADADENDSDVSVGLDQAFVGLMGHFGTVKVGTFDGVYDDAIQDGLDQFEYLGISGNGTTSEGDTIAYISPSFNGFEVQASAQVKGSADDSVTATTPESENGTAATLVVKYSVDALTLTAGYDNRETTIGSVEPTMGLAASYQVSPAWSVGAKFEDTKDEATRFGLTTRYSYGMGDLYGAYQTVESDVANTADYDEYGVGATYNLASNIYVYAEYGQQGSTEDQVMATGATYLF